MFLYTGFLKSLTRVSLLVSNCCVPSNFTFLCVTPEKLHSVADVQDPKGLKTTLKFVLQLHIILMAELSYPFP